MNSAEISLCDNRFINKRNFNVSASALKPTIDALIERERLPRNYAAIAD
jgi:hypothetical protein